jgi:phosphate-selective porin OprO and OprP
MRSLVIGLVLLSSSTAVAQTKTASTANSLAFVWDRGPVLESKGGEFRLRLGGLLQADGRHFARDRGDAQQVDQIVLRRVRINLETTFYRWFQFRLLPDFAGGTLTLQEAYAEVRYFGWARLRAGKFKEPFGLERLMAAASLTFLERAYPTQLAPNRDIGIQLAGELLGNTISYAVGLFDGVADGSSTDGDASDDKDVAGRLYFHPFAATEIFLIRNFGLGGAFTYGKQHGTSAMPGVAPLRTAGQLAFFSYATGNASGDAVIADGVRYRWSPQLTWYVGPIGLMVEHVESAVPVKRGESRTTLHHRATQGTLSIVITGDDATYESVRPERTFDPSEGTFGAVEVTGRIAWIDLDDRSFTLGYADPNSSATASLAWAAGVNWHLNDSFKVQLDFEDTRFDGGASGGDRANEYLLAARTQVAF